MSTWYHSHTIYKCSCGKIVGQCPCKDRSAKELVRFENCFHRRKDKHVPASELPVYKPK